MVPETIGRLRRIRRLGSGAFATVWLYHDDELDSDVAVKALADNWVDRLDVVERFLREARLLRAAGSEHVVEVYDIGETTDGTPYFVMSHADLGTVADLAERERLDPGTVADLVRQAARGLSDLHATGVIHRDVKPQNLLLRSDRRLGRRVLVTDLGLAKELAFASGLTRVVGSPGYQAPEQGRLGARLDERVDVYGLGAVAYRLLAGRPNDQDGPAELPDAPARVTAVVHRALREDPDGRWPDPLTFAAELSEASCPPGQLSSDNSASGGTRRSRVGVVVAVAAAVVAAVVVGLLVGTGRFAAEGGGPAASVSAPPAPAAYCAALAEHGDALEGLSDVDEPAGDGPQRFRQAVAAAHTLRAAAPPEVAADWAAVDDPLVRFENALRRSGSDWDRYVADPDADPELAAAMITLRRELADTRPALDRIREHARLGCR